MLKIRLCGEEWIYFSIYFFGGWTVENIAEERITF